MAAFLEQLWIDLAIYRPDSQIMLLTNEDGTHETLPGNMTVKYSKRGLPLLKQLKLVKLLNNFAAERYITLQEDGITIITATDNNFKIKDLLNLRCRIQFYKAAEKPYNNDDAQVKLVKPAFEPLSEQPSWAEAESLKTKYSGGRDFFLITGDIDASYELIELLKAFSIFKKWQQSNMQLLIVGFEVPWTTVFEEKLSTYKYRDDVTLLKDIAYEEIVKLAGISYAVLCPGTNNVHPLPLVLAIQHAAAIIASDIEVYRQFTDAAIWIDNKNMMEEFGKAMILLYKDEDQKRVLAQQVKKDATTLNRANLLQQIWQQINACL